MNDISSPQLSTARAWTTPWSCDPDADSSVCRGFATDRLPFQSTEITLKDATRCLRLREAPMFDSPIPAQLLLAHLSRGKEHLSAVGRKTTLQERVRLSMSTSLLPPRLLHRWISPSLAPFRPMRLPPLNKFLRDSLSSPTTLEIRSSEKIDVDHSPHCDMSSTSWCALFTTAPVSDVS